MNRKEIGKKLFFRTNSASCDFPACFFYLKKVRGCGGLIKKAELHPSERAEDRNENYILFIFHHIFPHFPISSHPPRPLCASFRGVRDGEIYSFSIPGNGWRNCDKKEAGWSFTLSCASLFWGGRKTTPMMKITTN